MAPSFVLLPPMKPLAWIKIPFGTLVLVESSSSLRPRHCSGRAFLEMKEDGSSGTAEILKDLSLVSWYKA